MADYVIHPSINLGYSFPERNIGPGDAFDTSRKNLKLDEVPKATKPKRSNRPVSRGRRLAVHLTGEDDFMQDLLLQSQEEVNSYDMKLPYSNYVKSFKKAQVSTGKRDVLRGFYRLPNDKPTIKDRTAAAVSKQYNTPEHKKTRNFLSSSPHNSNGRLQQSTPVSASKVDSKLYTITDSRQKARKFDRPDLLELPLKHDPVPLTNNDYEPKQPYNHYDEVSVEDPLACHAGNILRMAIDTTMFSSYNDSFSSTFNNTFGINDNVPRSQLRKRGNYDNDENEKSILDLMNGRCNNELNLNYATKVEINAEDLQEAIESS